MADVKISALGAIASVAGEDLVAIVDDPSGTPASRKATIDQIKTYINAPELPVADTQTIVKGSADATKLLRFEVDGNTTGITGVVSTSFTTAKTLTLPDATDTLVGKATTDTLTNKTFDANGTGNSITNIENADISATASIAYSKLNLSNSIVTGDIVDGTITLGDIATSAKTEVIAIAVSDETTALTTGTGKATFRMPYAFTLTDIRASLTTAPTTSGLFTVDVNDGGTSIMTTNKLTIDLTEKTTETATTAPALTDTALANDAEITVDIDVISGGATETGLKVYLIGYQT